MGLVFLALADGDDKVEVKRLRIPGDREAVRHRAAIAALAMAWRATSVREAVSLDPALKTVVQKET